MENVPEDSSRSANENIVDIVLRGRPRVPTLRLASPTKQNDIEELFEGGDDEEARHVPRAMELQALTQTQNEGVPDDHLFMACNGPVTNLLGLKAVSASEKNKFLFAGAFLFVFGILSLLFFFCVSPDARYINKSGKVKKLKTKMIKNFVWYLLATLILEVFSLYCYSIWFVTYLHTLWAFYVACFTILWMACLTAVFVFLLVVGLYMFIVCVVLPIPCLECLSIPYCLGVCCTIPTIAYILPIILFVVWLSIELFLLVGNIVFVLFILRVVVMGCILTALGIGMLVQGTKPDVHAVTLSQWRAGIRAGMVMPPDSKMGAPARPMVAPPPNDVTEVTPLGPMVAPPPDDVTEVTPRSS